MSDDMSEVLPSLMHGVCIGIEHGLLRKVGQDEGLSQPMLKVLKGPSGRARHVDSSLALRAATLANGSIKDFLNKNIGAEVDIGGSFGPRVTIAAASGAVDVEGD